MMPLAIGMSSCSGELVLMIVVTQGRERNSSSVSPYAMRIISKLSTVWPGPRA